MEVWKDDANSKGGLLEGEFELSMTDMSYFFLRSFPAFTQSWLKSTKSISSLVRTAPT